MGINPDLLKPDPAVNLAVTVMMGPHTLSKSTVYDTGGSSHLVNDLSLLQDGTFVPAPPGRVVEAGTSSFRIKGTGTRVMKGILTGMNGRKVDLELRNVDLVEGFHTNIVSAALLRAAGIWHCGEDHTLNIGSKNRSVVVRKLKVVANLSFLEYTPLYQYSEVPPATSGTVRSFASQRRAPTGEEQVRRPIVRKDSEALWHARTGHLGVTALRKIPERGQNVAITGEPMETCEICRLAHASRVASRRPTERAPRPFYKVLWDLFDYPKGYDGSQWLLVMKDDYSGKLWSFPIASKAHTQLFSIIRSFERHVHRRYNLHLNVLKHDGEKGVIAIQGMTEYQRWAHDEGIEVQLSPPYTHEPNGGPERAGQEVIVRALKMLKHANLPEVLWPEAAMTATKLINMSPAKSQRFRSPDEVLFDWFDEHSKHQGTPAVRPPHADLRPDWSGIYVFGCKAFALQTSRAAGLDRRAYKVQLRGQIGYLVGYVASNIYRIWLPKHGRVIQTRDVTFDETQFYMNGDTPRLEPEVIEYLEVRPADIPLSDSGFTRDTITLWDQLEQLDDETVPTLRPEQPLVATQSLLENSGDVEATEGPVDKNSGVENAPEGLPDAHESGRLDTQAGVLTPRPSPGPGVTDENAIETFAGQGLGHDTVDAQELMEQPQGHSRATPDSTDEAIQDEIIVRILEEEEQQRPAEERSQSGTRSDARPTSPEPSELRRSVRVRDRARRTPWSANFMAVEYTPEEILLHEADPLDTLLGTFLSGKDVVEYGDSLHRTTHARIFVSSRSQSALERNSEREGMDPSEKDPPPRHWHELATHPRGDLFRTASEVEYNKVEEMGAWQPVRRAPGMFVLPVKWVWTDKFDENNVHIRCKARICVRGDKQAKNTLESTYAATLASRSFRIIVAAAAHLGWDIRQHDVVNAFLNAIFAKGSEPVYIEYPPGFGRDGYVLQLLKALYGLRESPVLWFRDFSSTLEKLGMISSPEEPCLYFNVKRTIFVVFYVDDFLVCNHPESRPEADRLIKALKDTYELKEQGDVQYYLGIRVLRERQNNLLWLCYDAYLEKVAKRFGLCEGRAPATPLPQTDLQTPSGVTAPKHRIKAYQERIGSILYSAIMVRPDLAFAASQLSRHLTNPSQGHLEAADWCIRYAYSTRYISIRYGKPALPKELHQGAPQAVIIASDASFADDPDTRRSSQGYLIQLFGGPVIWKASRQATVTTSTTEAELLALSETAKETIALKRFFEAIQLVLETPFSIACDNQQTIRLVIGSAERISTKLRHVDIHNLWLRQEHAKGQFQLTYVPTADMPADGLTKNLTRAKFEHFRSLLNLQDIRQALGEQERADSKRQFKGKGPGFEPGARQTS